MKANSDSSLSSLLIFVSPVCVWTYWSDRADQTMCPHQHTSLMLSAPTGPPLGFKFSLLSLFDIKQKQPQWEENCQNRSSKLHVSLFAHVHLSAPPFVSTDGLPIHVSVILSPHLFSCNHFFSPGSLFCSCYLHIVCCGLHVWALWVVIELCACASVCVNVCLHD